MVVLFEIVHYHFRGSSRMFDKDATRRPFITSVQEELSYTYS